MMLIVFFAALLGACLTLIGLTPCLSAASIPSS